MSFEGPRERFSLDRHWRFRRDDPEPFALTPQGSAISGWKWRPARAGGSPTSPSAGGWSELRAGQDVFNGTPGVAEFTVVIGERAQRPSVYFSGVDDNAVVYLNTIKLAEHRGWDEPFTVDLSRAWKAQGENVLSVIVENTGGPGGIAAATLSDGAPRFAIPTAARSDYDDASWTWVDVPHDYVVEGRYDPKGDVSHGLLPHGVGWYRRTFTLDARQRGKRAWLEFDGVYRRSLVWLNGTLLGVHHSGYTSFYYDVTDVARYGERNTLVVRSDAQTNEGWWYEGGGIYRHVWLTLLDPVHVAHWGVAVRTPSVSAQSARVHIETEVANETGAPRHIALTNAVLDAAGKEVASGRAEADIAPGPSRAIAEDATLADPKLWSPDSPSLYALVTEIAEGGRVVDSVRTIFGVRSVRFDVNGGLLVNDRPLKVQGTCNHQDFGGVGVALPDRLIEYKIEALKALGSNAYRSAHHPPTPELLDACDRLGMLVLDENRHLGDSPEILAQVESMVRRDRNHPSVFLWSMCNEEHEQGSELGQRQGQAINGAIKRLDDSRSVTAAMNDGWGKGLSNVVDVMGSNYGPDGYDAYHAAHPSQPMIATETASTTTTRGASVSDANVCAVSAYTENSENTWRPIVQRPFMAGSFIWTGFDYRGEPTPYPKWPCQSSQFGVLDTTGIPKDEAYYYRAWWRHEPLVHLFPHWNPDGKRRGEAVEVRAYANTERVELWLNGRTLGQKDMPRFGHAAWQVPYEPGILRAIGYIAGRALASDQLETTGSPARIELTPDRRTFTADGADVVVVRVAVVDAKRRIVPTASNDISFSVAGPAAILGVSNGDPASQEPDKAAHRRAFAGQCTVLIQSRDTSGSVNLSASSSGLTTASVQVIAESAQRRPSLE